MCFDAQKIQLLYPVKRTRSQQVVVQHALLAQAKSKEKETQKKLICNGIMQNNQYDDNDNDIANSEFTFRITITIIMI